MQSFDCYWNLQHSEHLLSRVEIFSHPSLYPTRC
jgi:hypothetical protein